MRWMGARRAAQSRTIPSSCRTRPSLSPWNRLTLWVPRPQIQESRGPKWSPALESALAVSAKRMWGVLGTEAVGWTLCYWRVLPGLSPFSSETGSWSRQSKAKLQDSSSLRPSTRNPRPSQIRGELRPLGRARRLGGFRFLGYASRARNDRKRWRRGRRLRSRRWACRGRRWRGRPYSPARAGPPPG